MDTASNMHIKLQYQATTAGIDTNKPFRLQVDLTLPGNGITAIFGHSGCGKTTLLRCIAGLLKAEGLIHINHQDWQNKRLFMPSHKRPLGYVFQEASLFAHLSVEKNLLYAEKRSDQSRTQHRRSQLLELLALQPLLQRMPQQLSGGERQRVAIARALLIQPQILLMDEPLASLDSDRKQEILPYLLKLKNELDIPIIYVSHDADEVARLADYLVVMENGCVVSQGPLAQSLNQLNPAIELGEDTGSIIDARISTKDEQWLLAKVSFNGAELWLKDDNSAIGEPVRIRILARDVSIALDKNTNTSITNLLPATVVAIEEDDQQAMALVKLNIHDTEILARLTRRSIHQLQLTTGSEVWAQIKSAALIR